MRTVTVVDCRAEGASTMTESARQAFLQRVERIPEVAIEVSEAEAAPGAPLVVYVPSLRGEAASRVFELEAEVLLEFPGARLDVDVFDDRPPASPAGTPH
jgi:hypothetical protein